MTQPDQITAAAAETGDVDLVISNAGITCQVPILAAPDIDDFRRTMEVNYFGTMNLLRAFADQVRARQGGILLILSVAAVSLSRSAPAYSASKAATLMLGSSVREELREDGVGVTVSLPGWIDTEMASGLPGEKATPREVAERSIDGHLAGDEVVWPDRFALLVREQVEHRMLDLLTQPRAVMNEVAAQFTGVQRMTELLLVRHGRPESGPMDPPLNEEGLEQAHALARLLADEPITAIVCSDLRRAQQTAEIIGEATGHTPYALPGLREWGLPADSMEYVALELLGDDAPQVLAIARGPVHGLRAGTGGHRTPSGARWPTPSPRSSPTTPRAASRSSATAARSTPTSASWSASRTSSGSTPTTRACPAWTAVPVAGSSSARSTRCTTS